MTPSLLLLPESYYRLGGLLIPDSEDVLSLV